MKLLSSVTAAIALLSPAFAQAPNVAIVASASPVLTNCRYTDVQAYLSATGSFSTVDIVDCFSTTPTAAGLAPYDVILTWSDVGFADPALLGDVLADFVDSGGGVVVAAFANTDMGGLHSLQGRWITGGYEVLQPGQGHIDTPASLGTILDPTHPSVQGVANLTATQGFRPQFATSLLQGTVIAEWDDGAVLVAAGATPNRIDLGLYPPSSNCALSFWNVAGDGDLLIANSLLAVAGFPPTGIGTAYCSAAINSTGVAGGLSALGSTVATTNDVTLHGSLLPANSFSFFISSLSQGFVMNPGGSTGNLCLAGSIGRYVGPGQIQQADSNGNTSLVLDLSMTPTPGGFVSIAAGETWNYQAWYRDTGPMGPISNFTNGYSLMFN